MTLPTGMPFMLPRTPVVLSGAIVRLPTSGPYLHTNDAHVNVGVNSVSIAPNGDLEVRHEVPGPVVTAGAFPDETLGGDRGIIAGFSGGMGRSYLRLHDTRLGRRLDLASPDDYARVAGPYANLWLFFMHAPAPN